jgi:excisionase family DNA binding protein
MLTQMMDVHQVAEWLRLSKPTVYRLTAEGAIPAIKVGGSLRFDPNTVARHLEKDAA